MKIRLLLSLLLWGGFMMAQNTLSKEEAIERFLSSNFDIRLSQSEMDLAAASASKKALGYYPTVNVNGGANYDYGEANQKFQDGREINATGNLTQVYNAGVGINYNLYQGGQRKYRLNQLLAQVDLANLQLRQQMELGLVQLLQQYHTVAQLQQQVAIQERQVELSREQREKIEIGLEYGRGNRADALQAQANYLRDSTRLFQAQIERDVAKQNLMNLMGQSSQDLSFSVDEEVAFNMIPNLEELLEQSTQQNISAQLLDKNQDILSYDRSIIQSQRRPSINASADYQYQFQDFGSGGFFAQQRSNGIGGGINVSWNLFDGGLTANQKQVWQVRQQLLDIQKDQVNTQLANQVIILKSQLDAARELIEVEQKNVSVAETNLEQAREQYALGGGDLLIVRAAQNNLALSETTLQTAIYSAKNIELQLIQTWGKLLDEQTIY